MSDVRQIAALARVEEIARVAAEDLTGGFEEEPRVRNQACHRDARITDSLFAADEVVGHNRTVRPRQHVVVQRVHLAERRAHLADAHEQAAWNSWKSDEAFFQVYAFFTERQKKIGTRVGIDDRLE